MRDIRRVLLVSPAERDSLPLMSCTLPAVAAAVPQDVEVSILDGRTENVPLDLPQAREGDLVGLSFECFRAARAYAMARSLRARGIPVIAGGPHPSAAPREVVPNFDAVVVGEVEGLFERILADARRGRLARVYRHRAPLDLSTLRPPRFDLLRRRRYAPASPIEATRGCPHHCGFCSSRNIQGTFRPIPIDLVLAGVAAAPSSTLAFMDDNLPASRVHARRLFEGMKGMGKRFLVQCHFLMAEDKELLRAAADAGCRGVFVGLESVSERSLAGMAKGWNKVERYQEWVSRFHDNGIAVSAGVIFGLDDDGPDVFERTADVLERIKVDTAAANLLVPFPGTELHAQMTAEGRVLDHDYGKYFGQYPLVQPKRMTVEQLSQGYRRFCEKFYRWTAAVRRWRRTGLGIEGLLLGLIGNLSYRSWRAVKPRPARLEPWPVPELDLELAALLDVEGRAREPEPEPEGVA